MNEKDIAHALQQRLVTANLAPVVFENQNANPQRPFIYVQHVPSERVDLAIAGGQVISRGFMAATVVIAEGSFTTPALGLVDAISALFPKALRLTITGGVITIPAPCRILPGFQDGSDYRVVVQVPYDASAV
ncbi:MAG: phage tail terminator-like protein [Cypionkella sp.]|nr:phage tail terminator-like protein [Cypionkella sp.]